MIDAGLYITYIGLILAGLLAVLFPIYFIIKDPKKSKGTFIGVGFLVVIYLISLMLSSGEANVKYGISEGLSKQIGAGIIAFYILLVLSFLMIIGTEIYRIFKR